MLTLFNFMNTLSEENYLKAIFTIAFIEKSEDITSKAIASHLKATPASVTGMMKKLAEKGLIIYEKYQPVKLTAKGRKIAVHTLRKHRLWELFLVRHLNFTWNEVHEVAEELEHIESEKLVNNLDQFLGFPKFDPHGDPIPDKDGNIVDIKKIPLASLKEKEEGIIIGVNEHSEGFLSFLEGVQLQLGMTVKVLERFDFDDSMLILLDNKRKINVSEKVGQNLFIKKHKLKKK